MSDYGSGVCARKGKWTAAINHPDGYLFTIGEDFATRDEARTAYLTYLVKFYPPGPPVVVDPAKHIDLSAANLTAPAPKSNL